MSAVHAAGPTHSPIWTLLDGLQTRCEMAKERLVVMTGAAFGADQIADEWCWTRLENPSDHESYPADWDKHGKRAGFIRNQQMLAVGKPEVVFAFRCNGESRGTDMMLDLAAKAAIPTYVITKGLLR